MKSKNKVLGVFNGSFLINLVEESHRFLIFLRESFEKNIGKKLNVLHFLPVSPQGLSCQDKLSTQY